MLSFGLTPEHKGQVLAKDTLDTTSFLRLIERLTEGFIACWLCESLEMIFGMMVVFFSIPLYSTFP